MAVGNRRASVLVQRKKATTDEIVVSKITVRRGDEINEYFESRKTVGKKLSRTFNRGEIEILVQTNPRPMDKRHA